MSATVMIRENRLFITVRASGAVYMERISSQGDGSNAWKDGKSFGKGIDIVKSWPGPG